VINTNTGNAALDGNTRELLNRIRLLEAVDILRGRLIEDVELANATDVDVQHLLGREFKGWAVVDLTGASTSGVIQRSTADYDHATTLRLTATGYGATITVSLWVF
jgi:hypothetical protein